MTREWKRRFKEVGKEGTGGEAGLEIEEALDYLLGIVLEVLSRDEVPPIWIQSLEYVICITPRRTIKYKMFLCFISIWTRSAC